MSTSRADLYARLDDVSLVDANSFRRRLKKARSERALTAIAADLDRAADKVAARRANLPDVEYPDELPVVEHRDEIAEAITQHQVVIIAGETGSGKTTQIPKICLELGRGVRGFIGHTQPRRLAARTVAERIAEELGQGIGQTVGYAIRFDDRVSPTTSVKLMTDGILLAEMQRDRYLRAYDTIIIDEAHERSLNIDFILGYLKNLLPKRPDLKVIITSATIDPERFAAHFAEADGTPAPIIEVSGRTYPVEIRYRPGEETNDDPLDDLTSAVQELIREGPGDILCFFPGERDIRDAMDHLGKKLNGVELTPLFGRLSNAEQHRVFASHRGRRIVLATNIAETSLTVPGIRYVVDTGTARISRYSVRRKVQRLPIEPISQASANQRSGRCGRVAEGIAIRLYSEEDFLSRPEFTDPEILRTNLASVILQMASLRLGEIAEFPFIQPPDHRAIRDGLQLLTELGAITGETRNGSPVLTKIGRDLARIPVDPRLARMLVEAHTLGSLREVITIVAALTIRDVRERPLEFQAQADQQHARFKDKTSDFLSYLKLWEYINTTRDELSGNAFRKRMKKEFLHVTRIREWWDLVRQLRQATGQLGWDPAAQSTNNTDAVHQALLVGLLSQIGVREGNSKEFFGSRGTRFMVFPGSALAKKPPQMVMAAEMVETSRLWARDVAAIQPAWVESAAGHLIKHQYSEPFWSSKRGSAMAHQKSTLYGVTIVADRVVSYHTIDPVAARDMFIREALVGGDWNTHHSFFHDNAAMLADVDEMEAKARRRDLAVTEDVLFDFYDRRIPSEVTNANTFNHWWKRTQKSDPGLLRFDPAKLVTGSIEEAEFPNEWSQGSLRFQLSYLFQPGAADDGVTVHIPVPLIAGVSPQGFDWLVPGLRQELVTELIRSLPKDLRRRFVPAPDYASRVLPGLKPYVSPIVDQLAEALRVDPEDFNPAKLPTHLKMRFAAVDKRGKVIDADTSLAALRKRQAGHISSSLAGKVPEHKASTFAELGEVAEETTTKVDGQRVKAYPALVVHPDGMKVEVKPTRAAADAAQLTATLTLLLREISVNVRQATNGLPLKQRVAVEHYPHGGKEGLVADARVAAVRDAMMQHGGAARSPEAFERLLDAVRPEVPGAVRRAVVALAPALVKYLELREEVGRWSGEAIDDINGQLNFLLPSNAITMHGMRHLRHLPRYLEAIELRMAAMERDPDRDADNQDVIDRVKHELDRRLSKLPKQAANTTQVKDIRWQIEELRVSLFAQRLGTAHPVSERRVTKQIEKLGR